MKAKYSFHVPDMSCGHCVKRISGILDSMGVEGFDVSLEGKLILVDSPLSEAVLKALEEAGYPVSDK
ncbi:MAG: heavy-metal-associated domain-containing protein [Thermovirgaceae bacterium]|nr:heavy-metal-associated domain-containing protein [Thermovirgaceae bacterium]